MLAVPIGEFAVLLCAIDVVGQGESVYPLTTYLLGWLRGRVSALNAPPRLELLAADLSREMSTTGADAGFFLGLLQRGSNEQEVRYESIVDRYPHPLLLVGEQLRTVPSTTTAERGAVHTAFFPHVIGALRCPWRLVVSSDGLLTRLGGGSEAEGSRVLRRWQSSTRRDRPITEQLEEEHPPVDDESIMIAVWDGWDEEITLTAGNVPEEERVLRRLLEVAAAHVERSKSEALVQSVLEALDNASAHAYDRSGGPVRVRWRVYENRLLVEVVDVGCGISPARTRQEGSGLSVMRRLCALSEVRRNDEGGTTVVLVVDKEGGRE